MVVLSLRDSGAFEDHGLVFGLLDSFDQIMYSSDG